MPTELEVMLRHGVRTYRRKTHWTPLAVAAIAGILIYVIIFGLHMPERGKKEMVLVAIWLTSSMGAGYLTDLVLMFKFGGNEEHDRLQSLVRGNTGEVKAILRNDREFGVILYELDLLPEGMGYKFDGIVMFNLEP